MTTDEIIAMAREAGFTANCGHTDRDGTHHPAINALSASVPVQWLERFAALVAARERECVRCRRREPGKPDHQTHMEPPVFVGGKCPMRIEP